MAAKGCTTGETLRVVLLGKTGAGKSTLGNELTGLKPVKRKPGEGRDTAPPRNEDPTLGFKEGRGVSSMTVFCDWRRGERLGTVVEVTDTPGLCDTKLPEQQIHKEVAKSVAVAEPGPHVIVFVLRCDRPFTWEEKRSYDIIRQLFTEEINKYLILVLNGLSCYKDEAESLEGQRKAMLADLRDFGEPMASIVKAAGERVFGMSNELSPSDKDRQALDLINMMKDLLRRNGYTYYQNEITECIKEPVEKLTNEEALTRKVSKSQARAVVNRAIITEEVRPSFWETVTGAVYSAARKVKDGVQNICSVM